MKGKHMNMPMRTLLCVAALVAAASAAVAQKASTLSGSTITCNSWNGRHSLDPKLDWDNVDENAPVVLSFKGDDLAVTFPNNAFPPGVYPASVAEAKPGMRLQGANFVYQSISPAVIDTISIDGLNGGSPRAVWQRFRLDEKGAHPIVLQGNCTRK